MLLPSKRVPLHIFEDRYKELIGECLAEGSEFGLILETEEEGLREIGTGAAVLEVIHHVRRRPDERPGRGARPLPGRRALVLFMYFIVAYC